VSDLNILGKPWRRSEDNIRMDLKEIGNNTRNWVDSSQNRDYQRALVNIALNLRIVRHGVGVQPKCTIIVHAPG
jgi:hypothetical protein